MEEYKSARGEAEHVAALLRAALTRAGLPEDQVANVRPLVTSAGRSYVQLGALRLRDAVTLLEALPLSQPLPSSGTAK
ncbi:hypothetical protein OG729_30455 [Streptomyces sp. NBC_00210]|uniref:hypothetical protein n=1 Tax=unclassified Streptomyces TaxID=2593676 RepID=UPI003244B00C